MHRFVVGTGRCGSTLLSRMLGECPDVLSLFELFTGLDWGARFDPAPIPGAALAELLSCEQPFVTAVLRRGYPVAEITYPFADDPVDGPAAGRAEGRDDGGASSRRGRHRRSDPLPWILVSMLPRLSSDPDTLFDEVMAFVSALPEQPPRDHYLALFDWLCAREGRSGWIERSGSSIDYAESLTLRFPKARFVHIHRAGPEVALSMREHHAYRLPISLLYDVPLDDGRRVSELPPLDFDAAPTPDDTISRILASRPPAEHFGRYWCDQVLRGRPHLAALPPHRFLEVSFEALVRAPRAELARIADFFALDTVSNEWIDRAAGLVRGVPPLRAPGLPADEQDRLARACAPGTRMIEGEH